MFLTQKSLKQYYYIANVVNNDYQQDSKEKYAFVLNKSFGQFLDILPKTIIFLKAFNSQFSYIEVWFTNQSSKAVQVEYKNITLVIGKTVKCKK